MHTENDIQRLQKLASQVRRDILRMVHQCQSGHPGGALGATDFFVALYFHVLRHNKNFNINGTAEDLFFLSNGHISLAWSGYFELNELGTFRKINSRLQGHPATHEHLPGIRIASGSLGQGLSAAIGAALTKKLKEEDFLVFSLHGDGELQEGQIWEAAMYAAHNKVDNLISTMDVNGQQIDGPTEKVLSLGNLYSKWKAFGWDILEMNGNDMIDVLRVLELAKAKTFKGKPIMILMQTDMGYGVDFMMGTHKWHGAAPNDEQLANALGQLEETSGDY